MKKYLYYNNLQANLWTNETVGNFIELLDNDDRVTERVIADSKDISGRYQIKIQADLGRGEILDRTMSVGAAAGLLHCPQWQCKLNAITNMRDEMKSTELSRQSKIILAEYIDNKLTEYKTDIGSVLYVVNCYATGRFIRKSKSNERAIELISWNQQHGTGSWFAFTR